MRRLAPALCLALAAGPALAQDHTPADFVAAWDRNGDGLVLLPEIEARRHLIYMLFDADLDGALSAEEFDRFDAARAGEAVVHDDLAFLLSGSLGFDRRHNDANADGTVTYLEFIAGAANWLTALDTDGDGALTEADLTSS